MHLIMKEVKYIPGEASILARQTNILDNMTFPDRKFMEADLAQAQYRGY